jgi:hypothetical protein
MFPASLVVAERWVLRMHRIPPFVPMKTLHIACTLGFLFLVACGQSTPQPSAAPTGELPEADITTQGGPSPSLSNGSPSNSSTPSAPSSAPAASSAMAPVAPPKVEPQPELVDASGATLPQTEDLPKVDSASFQARLGLLWEAIVNDEPERAKPSFFPVKAYQVVKAIKKPEIDWERRLFSAFKRNIHDYHKQVGKKKGPLKLIGISIPDNRVKWMKPHSEGNLIGYHRVLRSFLRYQDGDGQEHQLTITSLISWRGEWYVVHLNGFKLQPLSPQTPCSAIIFLRLSIVYSATLLVCSAVNVVRPTCYLTGSIRGAQVLTPAPTIRYPALATTSVVVLAMGLYLWTRDAFEPVPLKR